MKSLKIILSFLCLSLCGQQPPRQILHGSHMREQAQQLHEKNYTFDGNFLMRSTIATLTGIALLASGEISMQAAKSDPNDGQDLCRYLPIVAGVVGIHVLCVGCGGCYTYWQERCCDTKHKIE